MKMHNRSVVFRGVTLLAGSVLLLTAWGVGRADAQELRIFTRLYDVRAAQSGEQETESVVVSRSLSLFHVGKVYDYLDNVNEVIVFEPVHNRFTIFSKPRMLATQVDLDQIKHLLKLAEKETHAEIARLEELSGSQNVQIARSLDFMLHPEFEFVYNKAESRLMLKHELLQYQVKCAKPIADEVMESYLRYADWMARLNTVLHPRSLGPGPRLELNRRLREVRQIPVSVELLSQIEAPLHLRAEHQIQWKLDGRDRALIHHWETLLKDKNLKYVAFRDYQQAMLVADSRPR